MMQNEMRVLGITGGVGAGKSRVLQHLQKEYGAVICRLDSVAKILEKKGQICYTEIVEEFGEEVLKSDGELDRKKLAAIVFSNQSRLQRINEIVHPKVKEWVQTDIQAKKEEGAKLYVIESAILPVVNYQDICPEMWYIFATDQIRKERLIQTRGYTKKRVEDMFASQPKETFYTQVCSVVIDNSGKFEDTIRQIGERL